MSWLLSFDWLSVVPWLLGALGAIFGVFQHSSKKTAQKEAEIAKIEAKEAKNDADLQKDVLGAVLKRQTKKEGLKDEAKNISRDRGHFS